MDDGSSEGSEARFAAYVEALGAVLGHADRQEPMRWISVEFLCSCCEAATAGAASARLGQKETGIGHATRARPHQDQRGSAEGRKLPVKDFGGYGVAAAIWEGGPEACRREILSP